MTLSVVATLGLGGAVAYQFGHPSTATVPASALQQGTTTTTGGATGGTTSSGSLTGGGSRGTSGTSGTAGHTVTSGGASGSTSTAPGEVSNQQDATTGVSNGVITVGGIYDETGPLDATVERDTVRSYFDLVNAQGGVNGYKL